MKRPDAPVPQAWSAPDIELTPHDAAKTHWRNYFADPRLQSLITQALENNRDLKIAAARVVEARALYGVTKAEGLPSLSLGATAGASLTMIEAPLAVVSYELDFWGRLAGLSDSARFSFLATEEARRAVRISLVADVASAYFTLLQLDAMAELSQATADAREQSLELLTKGRDLGGLNDFEVQQAAGILEMAKSALADVQYQRVAVKNRLDYLVGKVAVMQTPGYALEEQDLDLALAPGLPSEVLLVRPDVMASEQRLRAAHANIGVARTAFFPKIALVAGFGVASQGLASLLSGSTTSFSPRFSLPALFDGGRTAAGVEVAEARKSIALAEYERTIQLAFREVSDQLAARASLVAQMRSANVNKASQERRLQIAWARHNAGMVGYLEVLDAQRELFAAQQAALQVRRAQLESAVQLYKALGGGEQRAD
ncbi:efflux transporter outer membrane subunit [Rhodoferax aquaticus]|uniref:efflux transporter outer membrane subunit n=1 Tax=Rhodoferax aquaticus TaxID=2527691 RepID=UPI00143D1244